MFVSLCKQLRTLPWQLSSSLSTLDAPTREHTIAMCIYGHFGVSDPAQTSCLRHYEASRGTIADESWCGYRLRNSRTAALTNEL